jgi:biopolymer transport protein ExbB
MYRVLDVAMVALIVGAGAGCSFNESGLGSGDGDASVPDPVDARPVADAEPPDAEPVPTAFEKPITLDGDRVRGDHEDFPVYLELTDADLQARATATGDDIYFVDADSGSPLDHEIQRWEPQTGRLEVWVRIPELDEGTDVELLLRYGEPDDAPAPDPAGVWQAGFVAVWHLEQPPAGGAEAIIDSVGGHHGTASSLDDDRLIAATLGRGLQFEGGDEEITFSNPLTGASPHTISAWVDQGTTNSNDALVVLGTGVCGQARWFHTRYTGGAVAAGFYCDDITGGPNIQDQGPTLMHWTYTADDESRIYRDGALVLGPTEHLGTQATVGDTGRIGNAPGTFGQNMGLVGVVDEVRIATVAREPEWIATEFANQSAPDQFYSVGAERPVPR